MTTHLDPTGMPPSSPNVVPPRGNGLATAGFVLALVAVVLCLVPIVNNVAFVLAALGLVLGIVGLVKARKGAPRKGLAVAAVVLSIVAGAGVLASQAFYGEVVDQVAEELDDTPTSAPVTTDEGAQEASQPDQEPAEPEPGTRENPYAAGETVSNDSWDLTVGQPREAWAEIEKENMFNEPPAEGMEYWLVPLTGTYKGEEAMTPWVDLSVEFVGDDSVTYDGTDCPVVPKSLLDVGELYAGGTFEANACVVVPAGAPGLFTLTSGWFSDPVFFAKS